MGDRLKEGLLAFKIKEVDIVQIGLEENFLARIYLRLWVHTCNKGISARLHIQIDLIPNWLNDFYKGLEGFTLHGRGGL
jgi:hypothetical protein